VTDTTMNRLRVYRVSRGWRIFFAIALPGLAILFGCLMVMPFLEGRSGETGLVVFCFVTGAGFMLLFLFACFSVFKSRIEIFPDRIRNVGLFRTTELLSDEISGFRVLSTQYVRILLLVPKNAGTKKIKIGLIVEDEADLLERLNRNFTNLDDVQFQEEMKQVLHDTRLGETQEQRLSVLDRARRWARILNGVGIVTMFWAILKPQPYAYAIWTLIILPLIALGFVRFFGGVVKFDGEKQSAFPDISPAFLMPCLGLTLRAFLDWNILNWDNFWLPFAALSLSLYWLTRMVARGARRKVSTALALVIVCALYGYSSVISVNGILDRTTPSVFRAWVTGKRISRGKHTSYHLKLSPWGPRKDEKEVDVRKAVYDRNGIGDSVDVVVRHGRLKIPWFYIK
jgi:hypothetical protein